MAHSELVGVNGVEFFVELADTDGPQLVGYDQMMTFDGVRDTIQAIASEIANVWDAVKPSEATVEFGLSLTAKSGRLTGLLVDGNGTASLKVTLVWRGAGGADRDGDSRTGAGEPDDR